jgi:hypothetical protein
MQQPLHQSLEVSEKYADGQASHKEFAATRALATQHATALRCNAPPMVVRAFLGAVAEDARILTTAASTADDAAYCYAIHAANYPRHPAHDPDWGDAYGVAEKRMRFYARCIFGNPFRPVSVNPAWLTPTVTNLATAAYEERALPSGELDTARLTVLADALEEAGCDNADILEHLRSPGPHVRGCFALDALLNREVTR